MPLPASQARLVAIVKGGLGNQLFVYAAARALALRTGRTLLLDPSSGFLGDSYQRAYRLNRFPIAGEPAPDALRLGPPKSPRHRRLRFWNRFLPPSFRNYFAQKSGHPAAALLDFHSRRRTLYLNGYWQDEACFRDAADAIRRELDPPPSNSELEAELENTPSVSLHVRRVRYSPRLDTDYYQAAIQQARESLVGCRFEVFGDDLEWARTRLDFHSSPARFHDPDPAADELHDFRLLSRCRHAIVANSSFSWWAAWLQTRADKRVWFPRSCGWPLLPAPDWTLVPNSLET